MRMIEVIKTFTRDNKEYKQGHRYVMAEDNESQLRNVAGDFLGMSYSIDPVYHPYKGEDLNGKRLLCWRTGGIGDMFFLIPVLCHLKKKYPESFIRIASGAKQPLENLPEIDELYDMPFDARLFEDTDYHLMFQGIIESSSEEANRTHAADMFFKYFGIDSLQLPPEEKTPKLVFTEKEMSWRDETLKQAGIKTEDYLIGIQLETSSPLRNFPKDRMKTIIDVLAKEEGTKLFLIGSEQQRTLAFFLKGNYKNVIPAVHFNVRQSIVLATRYDLIVAPDTFMVQAAGALNKPLVGLYGPFPSEVRMKYFKNAIGLDPKVVCSPCFKHDFRPCIKGFPSPCFTLISTEAVLQAINFLKKKFTGKHFGFMERLLKEPDFSKIERYFLSADKGICFFPGYYRHHNMIRVDTNFFVGADITDLNTEFKRFSYPFVVYMNNFSGSGLQVYNNVKNLIRPGGYFIVYKDESQEQFLSDILRDVGKTFVIQYSEFNPVTRTTTIVGKKKY